MAAISFAIFSMCLLTFGNCGPTTRGGIELIVPEKCMGMDFCSEPPTNYDLIQERINSLLPIDLMTDVQDRQGNEGMKGYSPESDWHNCPTWEYMDTPVLARDSTFPYKHNVVVQHEKFKQTFLAVTCWAKQISLMISKVKHQCFPDLYSEQNVNIGMQSTCAQRYSNRTLYIYDHDKDELEMKSYDIPVFCYCKLTD